MGRACFPDRPRGPPPAGGAHLADTRRAQLRPGLVTMAPPPPGPRPPRTLPTTRTASAAGVLMWSGLSMRHFAWGLLEALGKQPALVGQGPGVAAPPGPAVAQQEHAQPVPGTGPVHDHVGAGPAQVPDRFLLHGGDTDRHQLPGPVQPGQPAAIAPVGLGPCRRGPWGSARARPPRSALPCCAAAGPGRSRSGRPPSRLAASGGHQGGQRACAPTPRHEESGRRPGRHDLGSGPPPRWCPCGRPAPGASGQAGRHWARPAPSVCGSVRAIVDDPRTVTCGTEPAAPC